MGQTVYGAGLGFRRDLIPSLREYQQQHGTLPVDFFEIAPENWMNIGGRFARDLHEFTERFPFVCHGLSLSIGSFSDLDTELLRAIKKFIHQHNIRFYTEHFSWCSDDGHLYDLLPIPCTHEAVDWVVERILRAQDILQMQIGFENASYYVAPPGADMKEEEFISEVVKRSGCFLHLDVNNVFVNASNFNFDPLGYLRALPLDDVRYLHVAGHFVEDDGTRVDTHGADVIDPVWHLLDETFAMLPDAATNYPTLLERDFNYPELSSLLAEVETIRQKQALAAGCDVRSVNENYGNKRSDDINESKASSSNSPAPASLRVGG